MLSARTRTHTICCSNKRSYNEGGWCHRSPSCNRGSTFQLNGMGDATLSLVASTGARPCGPTVVPFISATDAVGSGRHASSKQATEYLQHGSNRVSICVKRQATAWCEGGPNASVNCAVHSRTIRSGS